MPALQARIVRQAEFDQAIEEEGSVTESPGDLLLTGAAVADGDVHGEGEGTLGGLEGENLGDDAGNRGIGEGEPQVGDEGKAVEGLRGRFVGGDDRARPDQEVGEQALEEGVLEHAETGICDLRVVFGLGEQVVAGTILYVRLAFEKPIEGGAVMIGLF